MQDETRLNGSIWSDRDNSKATTINPPIYKGSTVIFDNYADMVKINRGEYNGIIYGTDRLPTQRQFEEALRELEGGTLTRILQSGIAAIQTVLMAFCKSGDHILICDNTYGPGQHFCKSILSKFNIAHTLIPPEIDPGIEDGFPVRIEHDTLHGSGGRHPSLDARVRCDGRRHPAATHTG